MKQKDGDTNSEWLVVDIIRWQVGDWMDSDHTQLLWLPVRVKRVGFCLVKAWELSRWNQPTLREQFLSPDWARPCLFWERSYPRAHW